ncbi:MAG: chemotaxis protein CheD [Firmicutes bacterium]|jgi:chemotaxis protein CheD|nr:chemotaxis protein CheD [Bacillota bacterium]
MAEIFVNMGQIEVARADGVLVTVGLGSCVGVAIYDRERMVGGMAHVFLAASKDGKGITQPGKFADTAIPALVEAVMQAGGRRSAFQAKIAGGANLFPKLQAASLNVGRQNVMAVKEHLQLNNVPLRGEDVEGNSGRKMTLYVKDGIVVVQSIGDKPREI